MIFRVFIIILFLSFLEAQAQTDTVYNYLNFPDNEFNMDSVISNIQDGTFLLYDSNHIQTTWDDLYSFYSSTDTIVRESLTLEPNYSFINWSHLDHQTPDFVIRINKGDMVQYAYSYGIYSSEGNYLNSRVLFYLQK